MFSCYTPAWFSLTTHQHTVFTDAHLRRLEEITRAICPDFQTELANFNGHTNHVHLLVNFPPKVSPSRLVNLPQGRVSSRGMRERFPALTRHYWRAQQLWSGFYFTGSVAGAPTSMLRQHIPQQNSQREHSYTSAGHAGSGWAFTTALKGGALAHIPVAPGSPARAATRR